MENTGFVEETIKEIKLSEIESCKVPVTCTSHSANGLEACCKSGAFLIPLCVVI
jgi:hypothetical protein